MLSAQCEVLSAKCSVRSGFMPNAKCPVGRKIVEALRPQLEAAERAAAATLGKTNIADLVRSMK